MTDARHLHLFHRVQAFLLCLLSVLALALLLWQHPSLPAGLPSTRSLLLAVVSMLLWLALLALTVWRLRAQRLGAHAAALAVRAQQQADSRDLWLVLVASQTGVAERIAQQTLAQLQQQGHRAQLLDLGALEMELLQAARRVLLVASTTGDGDAPDPALAFTHGLMRQQPDLRHLHYGLLALGDSDYADFCGFGRKLDHWLARSGAQPLFARIEVNREDPQALADWQACVHPQAADTVWQSRIFSFWRLQSRRLLNPGSAGNPCHLLSLVPVGDLPDWQAGDIAEIRLPSPASATEPPQHRDYSIASLPDSGCLQLLVREMRTADGGLGAGSRFLLHEINAGDELSLHIRPNRHFHLPDTPAPLLLIGNGTGIAALRALLLARAQSGQHDNWLVFGERTAAHDFFFADDLQRWQQQGHLQWLDLAWSREAVGGRHVQDVLQAEAATVEAWLQRGACLYVCGSTEMGRGVDACLEALIGVDALQALRLSGRYRRDLY